VSSAPVGYRVRGAVDDVALSQLHDAAFGGAAFGGATFGEPGPVLPWRRRLAHHSLTWVEAYALDGPGECRLVGFVNVVWDGGSHAFLLDTCVDERRRHRGIGLELVRRATDAARQAGCTWLHVDFEAHLATFYARCGFSPTAAGLLHL
jgi:GNAT superfamily N-acetyltransferase